MTLEQQLAEAVALEIATALEPVQRTVAAFEVASAQWVAKSAWDQSQAMIADLERRLADVVARAPIPGPPGPPGQNGKDGATGLDGKAAAPAPPVTEAHILAALATDEALLEKAVSRYLVAHPPKDGAPGINGKDGRDAVDGTNGEDGIGLAGAVLTKDGALVLTLSDGSLRDVGVVIGTNGTDGINGHDGKDAELPDIQAFTALVADRLLHTKSDRETQYEMAIEALSSELAWLRTKFKSFEPAPDAAVVGEMVTVAVTDAVGRLPVPQDGKDAAPVDIQALAAQAALLIPAPRDGHDGKDAAPVDLEALAVKAAQLVPTPKDGRDGKDAEPFTAADAAPIIAAEVTKAIAAIPAPKDGIDGKSLTADDVAPMLQALVEKSFSMLPMPKDGVGIKTAVVDRAGHFVLTLTDGSEKDLGSIVGTDGAPGLPGVPGREGEKGDPGINGTNGLDGTNGSAGRDGLGFDDLSVVFDERKGYLLRFTRGEEMKDFPIPIPFDAGIWQSGRPYPKGAGVTVRGAFWIAQRATTARPGDEGGKSVDWRMSVKSGEKGIPGPPGRDGVSS